MWCFIIILPFYLHPQKKGIGYTIFFLKDSHLVKDLKQQKRIYSDNYFKLPPHSLPLRNHHYQLLVCPSKLLSSYKQGCGRTHIQTQTPISKSKQLRYKARVPSDHKPKSRGKLPQEIPRSDLKSTEPESLGTGLTSLYFSKILTRFDAVSTQINTQKTSFIPRDFPVTTTRFWSEAQ